MLPSCKEVAELISENIDQPVKGNRWLKMKLHLAVCTYCRRYNHQLELTQKTVAEFDNHVCEDVKEKIFKEVEASYQETHVKE